MKYAFERDASATIRCIVNWGGSTQLDRQQGDLVSLLSLFKNASDTVQWRPMETQLGRVNPVSLIRDNCP
jgi:hypothetical protein